MSKAINPVKLAHSIKRAVAEKAGAVETTAEFFKHRAGKAKPSYLLFFLDGAPDNAPARGDEP